MDNREYFLLSKVENILVAKNYEFQTHNNMIRVYFDSEILDFRVSPLPG